LSPARVIEKEGAIERIEEAPWAQGPFKLTWRDVSRDAATGRVLNGD